MGAAIPLIAGGALGAIQGEQERKDTRRFNKGAAEANRFSDVTGRFTELKPQGGGALGGALKGAVSFGGLPGLGGGGAAAAPQVLGGGALQTGGQSGVFDALKRGNTQGGVGGFGGFGSIA